MRSIARNRVFRFAGYLKKKRRVTKEEKGLWIGNINRFKEVTNWTHNSKKDCSKCACLRQSRRRNRTVTR